MSIRAHRTRFGFKATVVVVAVLVSLGFSTGGTASAAPPNPGPDEVGVTVSVRGDRLPDGTVGTAPAGIVLRLTDGANTVFTEPWAFCTVDADGDCSFLIPLTVLTGPSMSVRVAEAVSPGWRLETVVDGSVSRLIWDFNGGETIPAWSVTVIRENPVLPTACGQDGLKIAFVVDLSDSMLGAPLASLKTAASAYVDALAGTRTEIALFTFSSYAPAVGPTNVHRPLTSIETQAGADQVKDWIDGWVSDAYTNWADPLHQVAQSGIEFDMVIFITDGNPNVDTYYQVPSANAIKVQGTRIIAVLVGVALTTSVPGISGTVSGDADVTKNDYFSTDWAEFGDVLDSLTTLCPAIQQSPVIVQYVDDDAGGAVVATAPGATTLRGAPGSAVGYTQADAIAGMPDHYAFVSLDNVTTFSPDLATQTITIHMARDPYGTVQSTRTIHYVGAGALTPADVVQTLTWNTTYDYVTGDTIYEWASGLLAEVVSPSISGYTPDLALVPAAVPVSPDTIAPVSTTVTVTYTAQQTTTPTTPTTPTSGPATTPTGGPTTTASTGPTTTVTSGPTAGGSTTSSPTATPIGGPSTTSTGGQVEVHTGDPVTARTGGTATDGAGLLIGYIALLALAIAVLAFRDARRA